MTPKYCTNCKYSIDHKSTYFNTLRCTHPGVNIKDSYELSRPEIIGRECLNERTNYSWFGVACGIKGKLYEPL